MGDLTMHDYHKLSGESDDSGYSNRSIEKPPSFNEAKKLSGESDDSGYSNRSIEQPPSFSEANKLSGESDDSGYSNRSIEQPPSFSEVLQKHGYTFKEELGRGATGIVFLVDEGEGNHVVVKQMNSRDRNELDTVTKEMKILKEMIHGYIVSYVDSFEDEQSGLYCIVMEYCAGGDLKKKMETQKEKGFFEEQQLKRRKGSQLSGVSGEGFLQKWRRQKAVEADICSRLFEDKAVAPSCTRTHLVNSLSPAHTEMVPGSVI